MTDAAATTLRPAEPGKVFGGVTIVSVRSFDDAAGRSEDGRDVTVATGQTIDLEVEARALEWLASKAKASHKPRAWAPTILARGDDEVGGGFLVLDAPPAGARPLVVHLRDAPAMAYFQLVDEILDVAELLEEGRLDWAPRVDDLWVTNESDGEGRSRPRLFVHRVRGAERLRADARFDARSRLEELGPSLVQRGLTRLPPAFLHIVLTHRARRDEKSTIEAIRHDLARARATMPAAARSTRATSTCAGLTDVGLSRERNEDAVVIIHEAPRALLVVCDGISASHRADVAARIAADTVAANVGWVPLADMADVLAQSIRTAHLAICDEHVSHGGEPLGTTAVAALAVGRRVAVSWVGDSRAYFLSRERRDDDLMLTRDHSWLNDVMATGVTSLEEALASPYAHALTRCLGPLEGGDPSTQAEPDAHDVELPGPGALILCSDGLWNYFPSCDELAHVLADAGEGAGAELMARTLVNAALSRGGQDNVTVAVLLID